MEHTAKTSRAPLPARTRTLLRGGLWIQGFLIAISVFSLLRETADQSWPLWRVVAHVAILAVSGLLMAATLQHLHHGEHLHHGDDQAPAPGRPAFRQPHLR